jgi:S-adenosyl-L-methionine hydrolase (adenosine-forming)
MARRFDTLTFLSDYGTVDEFAGVVRSVVRQIAPHVTVVDLTHDVAAHDVRAGALTLARAAQYLCPGVVLAVVDPGVGTDRRAVAVEVGDGESYLVGPDNGLLAPAVAMSGGATAVVELTEPAYQLASPGATFAGRDIFGPAAAHLCAGVPLADLGPAVDPITLLPGTVVLPRDGDDEGSLVCQVLWVDRYGNCQLNVGPDDVAHLGPRVVVRWGDQARAAVVTGAYGDVPDGQVGLVTDSYGMLSVCLPRRSAAVELGLDTVTQVTLAAPTDGPGGDRPPSSPVTLTARRPDPPPTT